MSRINLRNSIYLHSHKIIVIIGFLISTVATAQRENEHKYDNLINYDDKKMHYGFFVAPAYTNYNLRFSNDFVQNQDTLLSVKPKGNPAYTLGFIVNRRLGEFFDLRLLPAVGFYQRAVEYTFRDGIIKTQNIESTFIELPLVLKYKSERREESRMYIIAGIKPMFEVNNKKKEKRANLLRTNNIDLTLEYGFGFDIYYPMFKFAPEIRFSTGLMNLLIKDPNFYSQNLNNISTQNITLYFNFE
jgi:hypothetical protein